MEGCPEGYDVDAAFAELVDMKPDRGGCEFWGPAEAGEPDRTDA